MCKIYEIDIESYIIPGFRNSIQNDWFIITFVKKVLTMVDNDVHIAIGSDHAGYRVKELIKEQLGVSGYKIYDAGCFSEQSMDYPDSAHPVAKAVQTGTCRAGILICGSGNGMAITANKYTGIRAALCWSEEITLLARKHNDANILALPARFILPEDAVKFALLFLATPFEGGRHQARVDKISQLL
jgi:ribose 5-phosphate isomerase B